MICLFPFYPKDSVCLGTEVGAQTAKHFKWAMIRNVWDVPATQISFENSRKVSLLGVGKISWWWEEKGPRHEACGVLCGPWPCYIEPYRQSFLCCPLDAEGKVQQSWFSLWRHPDSGLLMSVLCRFRLTVSSRGPWVETSEDGDGAGQQ